MITKSQFKYPKANTQLIQPLTDVGSINELMKAFGPILKEGLTRSRTAFPEGLDIAASPYTTAGAENLGAAGGNLRNIAESGLPIDVNPIYDAMTAEAQRRAQTDIIPGIEESLGVRGGRFGSDIANAVAKAMAQLFGTVGIERAKAQVGAGEAAAGRRVSASELLGRTGTAQAAVGGQEEARQVSNLQRIYNEFLRMTQPQGAEVYGATQNFLQTPAIFPQTVAGPAPTYQPGVSWLDIANTIAKLGESTASITGAFRGVKK